MSDIRKRSGKKGNTYQVRYPNSKTKSGYAFATFKTLKEARAFLESGKARQQAQGAHSGHSYRVDNAIDIWLKICEKEGCNGRDPVTEYTLKNYRYMASIMNAYDWSADIAALQSTDIVEFRSWLLQNYSRYLARKVLSLFSSMMKEMAIRGHVAVNVATGISVNTSSRYDQPVTPPTIEEFHALLAAADRLANSKNRQIARNWQRFRPMIYLAGDTGMRPGELLALPRANVTRKEIKVDRAVERSGKKISVTKTPAGWRWIDISPETADLVLHYIEHHAPPSPYDLVFPTASGRWQCINNWRNRPFSAACIEAGLVKEVEENGKIVEKPKFSPYDLRHFYASMLIEQRVNLKRIQKLMGHSDITTTLNVYGHLIEKAEADEEEGRGLISSLRENSCGEFVASTL